MLLPIQATAKGTVWRGHCLETACLFVFCLFVFLLFLISSNAPSSWLQNWLGHLREKNIISSIMGGVDVLKVIRASNTSWVYGAHQINSCVASKIMHVIRSRCYVCEVPLPWCAFFIKWNGYTFRSHKIYVVHSWRCSTSGSGWCVGSRADARPPVVDFRVSVGPVPPLCRGVQD